MAFGSAIFVFAFLPLCAALYRLAPGLRAKNVLLAAAGLLFYAFGRLSDLPFLLGTALLSWLAGLLLLRLETGRRAILAATVALELGVLTGCKFWAGTMPLGVSFFTFQAISYSVDAYRDPEQASARFFPVLQYLCFFPNLVSGPLWRFRDMRPGLECRDATAEDVARGLRRFAAGLGKKLLLAAPLGLAADAAFAMDPAALDIRTAWLGALCYALQLYLDFSGYSDMAIGLGGVFGFQLPENFQLPCLARSITDFWRRWHITLSRWFRDYLYIPLGGNRRGKGRAVLNKLAVFLATGLWHGAGWTFLLWGLWHGLLSALETALPRLRERLERRWYGRVYALLAVVSGFVLFRAGSLAQAWTMLSRMFAGFALTDASTWLLASVLTRRTVLAFAMGLLAACGLPAKLRRSVQGRPGTEAVGYVLTLLLLVLCAIALAAGSFQPFIYQQF